MSRIRIRAALDWARERHERIGLFGYSFGGAVALCAGADREDLAAVAAVARSAGHAVETLPADHHFAGQNDRVAATVTPFFAGNLAASDDRSPRDE